MFDFSGKNAVITGAGGAIGGEIARGLAGAGARVAIWDISEEAGRSKAGFGGGGGRSARHNVGGGAAAAGYA